MNGAVCSTRNGLDDDENEENAASAATLENVSYVNGNAAANNANWRTLVLISVNLAGFEIKMNVGNVMGNVW